MNQMTGVPDLFLLTYPKQKNKQINLIMIFLIQEKNRWFINDKVTRWSSNLISEQYLAYPLRFLMYPHIAQVETTFS